jgi:stage III sporulation protein AF
VDQIAVWLKQLVAMVILAGFIEMILPDNQLQKVTRMVLSLLIIFCLVQPLSCLFRIPATLAGILPKVFSQTDAGNATAQVLRDGAQMRRKWQQGFETMTQQALQAKLTKVFTLFEGMAVKNVVCRYAGDRLRQVIVVIKSTASAPLPAETRQRRLRQAENSVRLFTGLATDQIEVSWE